MKILALDSTASVASIAVTENGITLAEFTINKGNTHSTTLLPMIETVLSVLSLTVSDIDLFVLSAGPGSFTGVRIGAATIKGLSFTNKTPCIGVSSLEAMAYNFIGTNAVICPSVNARRGQVYCALFRCKDGVCTRLCEDSVLPAEKLCEILSEYKNETLYFAGDGSDIILSCQSGIPHEQTPSLLSRQNAVGVAILGERLYNEASNEIKLNMTGDNLVPLYLKKSQAEREREEKLNNNGIESKGDIL